MKSQPSDIIKFHTKQGFLQPVYTLVSSFTGIQRLGQATIVFIWMSISTFSCLFHSSLLAHVKNWFSSATHTPVHVCVCAQDGMGLQPSGETSPCNITQSRVSEQLRVGNIKRFPDCDPLPHILIALLQAEWTKRPWSEITLHFSLA